MKDTDISEKTLELNICEELISLIRKKHPKAFWYGPTLQDENKCGYDTSMENVNGHVLFLQFKRPLKYPASDPKEYPYRFKILKAQNNKLFKLANTFPRKVHYVFPLIGDHKELAAAIPNIRKETNFTPVEVVGELEGEEEHRVDAWPDHIKVYSPVEGPNMNPEDVIAFHKNMKTITFSKFANVYNNLIQTSYIFTIPTIVGTAYLMEPSPLYAMFIPIK